MRKGQVDDWFADIIPGVLIMLLAYGLLSFASQGPDSLIDASRFQDTYDRAFITFLETPLSSDASLTASQKNQHILSSLQDATYGDLVFLATLDKGKSSLYRDTFAQSLFLDLQDVSTLAFQIDSQWSLNFSSKDSFTITDEAWNLPVFIDKPLAQSSQLALYYPLSEGHIPFFVTATLGTKRYFS